MKGTPTGRPTSQVAEPKQASLAPVNVAQTITCATLTLLCGAKLAFMSLGQPDPFRLKYRGVIADLVAEVVRSALGKKEAAAHVAARAGRAVAVAEADRDRLVEVVETELIHLHEGSIARYRLRPAEFERWIRGWT